MHFAWQVKVDENRRTEDIHLLTASIRADIVFVWWVPIATEMKLLVRHIQ